MNEAKSFPTSSVKIVHTVFPKLNATKSFLDFAFSPAGLKWNILYNVIDTFFYKCQQSFNLLVKNSLRTLITFSLTAVPNIHAVVSKYFWERTDTKVSKNSKSGPVSAAQLNLISQDLSGYKVQSLFFVPPDWTSRSARSVCLFCMIAERTANFTSCTTLTFWAGIIFF